MGVRNVFTGFHEILIYEHYPRFPLVAYFSSLFINAPLSESIDFELCVAEHCD